MSTTSSKSNYLRNIDTLQRESVSRHITHSGEINDKKYLRFLKRWCEYNCQSHSYLNPIKKIFILSICFIQLKVCWIYIRNMFRKLRLINGEDIVKISRGIVKLSILKIIQTLTITFIKFVILNFSPTRNMTHINVGLTLSLVKPELFSWKNIYIYVQFDGMVYQQTVGIDMVTNCAPFIADLLLYEGFYAKPPEVQTVCPHRQVQQYLSVPWQYINHW